MAKAKIQQLTSPELVKRALEDNFFKPIQNSSPFLKVGFEGFAGGGKSHTMALLANGWAKTIKSDKPIIIQMTENSSRFLKPMFEREGLVAIEKESRSLADTKEIFKRAKEGVADIVLIDSITHIWNDFVEAYKRDTHRTRLEFQDWGIIKPRWFQEFALPFIDARFSIMFTGRAGYEYEDEKDERGKRQIYKSGIKMKAEGETPHEPDILVLMESHEDILLDEKKIWQTATIIKDRSTMIHGKVFNNPTFKDFEPAIEALLSNVEAPAPQSHERDAAKLLPIQEENAYASKRQREIVLEEIQGQLTTAWPGMSAEEKRMKKMAAKIVFNTFSWTQIESESLDVLKVGLVKIKEFIKENAEAERAEAEDAKTGSAVAQSPEIQLRLKDDA